MDDKELREEIAHQRELQAEYRKHLRVLEKQAAKFGVHVPSHIQIEIDELNKKMLRCDQRIETSKQLLAKPGYDLLYQKEDSLAVWEEIDERRISFDEAYFRFGIRLENSDNKKRDIDVKKRIKEIKNVVFLLLREISEIENL